jgi:hypothetical protein
MKCVVIIEIESGISDLELDHFFFWSQRTVDTPFINMFHYSVLHSLII